MTFAEGIAELKKRWEGESLAGDFILRKVEEMLNEPAPNPFTPDQLAWMREEQRAGFGYAAMDENRTVKCFPSYPEKRDRYWITSSSEHCAPLFGFLSEVLSWDDPEPLCFADYAPLEGATK